MSVFFLSFFETLLPLVALLNDAQRRPSGGLVGLCAAGGERRVERWCARVQNGARCAPAARGERRTPAQDLTRSFQGREKNFKLREKNFAPISGLRLPVVPSLPWVSWFLLSFFLPVVLARHFVLPLSCVGDPERDF